MAISPLIPPRIKCSHFDDRLEWIIPGDDAQEQHHPSAKIPHPDTAVSQTSITDTVIVAHFNQSIRAIGSPSIEAIARNAFRMSDPLAAKIQDLPQELKDKIFTLYRGAQIPTTIFIDKSYKPPVMLQLDRKLRASFSAQYYGNRLIEVRDPILFEYPPPGRLSGRIRVPVFERWVRLLTDTHLAMLGTLMFSAPPAFCREADRARLQHAEDLRREISLRLLYSKLRYTTTLLVFDVLGLNGELEGEVISSRDNPNVYDRVWKRPLSYWETLKLHGSRQTRHEVFIPMNGY